MPRIVSLMLCLLPLTAPAAAQVYTDHLLGRYSATDNGCQSGATPEFEIRRGIVEGPNVFCILGATKPTDIGTEAYEANCRQPGAIGTLHFDLSNKSDHIRIMLPESQDWLTLYRCE
ncbi:MAG TPA: hypothetical protein VHK26_06830 [Methyloceanibacter sp.]|jgi:hypothetical protein|nr:hypothetical protein [Methyloceanibacter sp.]